MVVRLVSVTRCIVLLPRRRVVIPSFWKPLSGDIPVSVVWKERGHARAYLTHSTNPLLSLRRGLRGLAREFGRARGGEPGGSFGVRIYDRKDMTTGKGIATASYGVLMGMES